MNIVNVTPHSVTFQTAGGEVYQVPPSGVVISATPVEEPAGRHPSGVELVRTRFVASDAAAAELADLEALYTRCGGCGTVPANVADDPAAHAETCISGGADWVPPLIVGSIIAAQAFPGRVLALVPVAGYERVPPAEKRMRDDKFTVC